MADANEGMLSSCDSTMDRICRGIRSNGGSDMDVIL
jgi:hypothetical protein